MFCLAALIAGSIAAMTPAIIAMPIHKNVCCMETANTVKPSSANVWIKLQAKNIPNPVPRAAPNIEIIEDSIKIILLICFLKVPIALINPISLVLSYTDKERVFVIPNKATKMDMERNP